MHALLNRMCCIEGCEQRILARGWCSKHYNRWHRHGDPVTVLRSHDGGHILERFWTKVDKTDTCWNWTARTHNGYGAYQLHGKPVFAHRVAYELTTGNIPNGLQIDHRCHNKRCVNPDHLRLVTAKQNCENRSGAPSNSASGIRGVAWIAHRQRWLARVSHHGKRVYTGYFRTQDEAAAAVIKARNKFFTHNDIDRPRAKVQ